MICSKIVNFDLTEAGLTSKWGRISPAVQWCFQYCTVGRCTTSCDVTQKFVTTCSQNTAYIARQPLLKNYCKLHFSYQYSYHYGTNRFLELSSISLAVSVLFDNTEYFRCRRSKLLTMSDPAYWSLVLRYFLFYRQAKTPRAQAPISIQSGAN